MKSLRIVTTLASLLVGTLGALAAPAITTTDVTVRSSPGGNIVGSIRAQREVDTRTCTDGWCQVQGPRGLTGWVENQYLAPIAEAPRPQPQPQPQPERPWPPRPLPPQDGPWNPWPQPQPPRPQPQPPVFDEAGACFYSERNFRGSSFCLDEGESYTRLRNWNDRIRSVEVFGGARVDLCSDFGFYGECVTLRRDASQLPRGIDRRASSLEVY